MNYDISAVANTSQRMMQQLDVAAHNLANTSTSGFKAEHLHYSVKQLRTYGKETSSALSLDGILSFEGIKITDSSQGVLTKTGNSLDMAIEGEGFFCIQQKNGTTYTRNGSFVLNKNGELVTKTGLNVLGESGAIRINGQSVEVDNDGSIRVDGNAVGKVKIVTFKNINNLVRSSEGQFIDEGNAEITKTDKYRVVGGYLESSNVNSIKEMVDMIDLQRSFESYQKIILTFSDLDKISINKIGKLA